MLPLRSQISIVRSLLAVLIISTVSVLADTDVMPFKLPLAPSTINIPQSEIFTLSPNTYPQLLNVSNESPELWLSAPLEGDYKRWIARIHWPGSVSLYHPPLSSSVLKSDSYQIHMGDTP
jgi:hypothetical protein